MTHDLQKHLEQFDHHDRQILRKIIAAAKKGETLKGSRRFDAALELGRRYNAVITSGKGKRSAIEDRVVEILERFGIKTETFDIAKWKLPKNISQVDAAVRENPKYRAIPQKSMIHYLSAAEAIAEFAGERPNRPERAYMDILENIT